MSKSNCIAFFFLLLGASCGNTANEEQVETTNKKTVLNYVDTIWNQKDLNSLDQFFSNEFTRKVNNIEVAQDNAELNANINILFTAFPDLNLSPETIISTKKSVILNWNIRGTNTGVFGDLDATGKKVKISGMTSFEFNDQGEIIYENVYYNELLLLQQLGYTLTKPKVE